MNVGAWARAHTCCFFMLKGVAFVNSLIVLRVGKCFVTSQG